jgi:DNA-binding transcriptional ArsR family regulator
VDDGVHPMTAGWRRYRPEVIPVPIRDHWGNTRMVTPHQASVLAFARSHEGQKLTATVIADSLGVAVSTVTRALVRLSAYGLVAYDTARGRFGGITFLAVAWADLKGRARGAWSKIRHEREGITRRYLARLERSGYYVAGLDFNLATISTMDAKFNGA